MKVSLNWVKEFTDVDLSVDELVQKVGAQLGAVEEVIDLGKKYQGIVIARVVKCEKHSNADKLSVCTIDDGGITPDVKRNTDGYVEVVCGAPNVREGLLVAWLPPGVVVPSTLGKDPLTLEAREIRGIVSNGMIASARELGISDDHDGILVLDQNMQPGASFAEAFKLNDYIIDIENKMFTHRPDCFGMLGVAREVAGINRQPFTSPDWYIKENGFGGQFDDSVKGLNISNEIPELCPRYMAVIMSGIKIAPSPLWLQSYLSRAGIRPINNIVDMTNYMMVLTGQPLHAFDFDKVAVNGRADIIVRKPRVSEKMTLLDGKTIEPRADAILICNPEKILALGGVMGGNNSEIDANTTRIIIECANFDMYNIRKTAMEHGLFTDSVTRFTKGQSPSQCAPVLYKVVQVAQEVSPGAQPMGKTVDVNHAGDTNQPVSVSADFINARLGLQLAAEEMAQLLRNVEFEVAVNGMALTIRAPFWRTDIAIPEDIVEEVGRLYGYDKLPLELPKRDLTPAKRGTLLELKARMRNTLSSAGANEVLTYSFVHGNLLDKVGQDKEQAFKIANALSPDLQYYRLSLTPSLLEKVHPNIKTGYTQFALFELGKAHQKSEIDGDGLPIEDERLSLIFTAEDKYASENYQGSPYYQARKYLTQLLESLCIRPVFDPSTTHDPSNPVGQQSFAPFEKTRSAYIKTISGQNLGFLGEFTGNVRRNLKLPSFIAGFELDVKELLMAHTASAIYTPLPRFPRVGQDISLKVPASLIYGDLYDYAQQYIDEHKPEHTLATIDPIDIYQREDDKEHKQVTLRLTIASYERTMTAEEVNAFLDRVAQSAKENFDAERI